MNENINTKHAIFINWIPPFMEVLRENGGSATTKEIREGIAAKMALDDDFLAQRYEKSGLLKFDNQVTWAKLYLDWENLVKSSKKGVYSLTGDGWNEIIDYNAALMLVRKWVGVHSKARKNKNSNADDIVDCIEDENTDAVVAKDLSLIEILKQTTPTGFEHLCGRLLREYNFEDVRVTQSSGDGGIDGTATLKLNPFVNMSVYFQCKRYQGTVPISHIREFVGILATEQNGADRGIFITTGTLPKSAYELEKKNTKLELIDSERLVEMFEKAGLGVTPRIIYDPDMAFFAQYMEK